MACALLAIRGYRVIYLGADIPVEQVAATVTSGGIEVVVMSVSAGVPRAKAEREIARLRHSLPHRVPLWVGGAGAPGPARGVERFGSLAALSERLR
jgi:methanogenic corrinoid protein MtbC1